MSGLASALLPESYKREVSSQERSTRIVFWIIAAVLLAVFFAYQSRRLRELPCGDTWWDALKRNFIHIELPHLLANLFAFWTLSRIEDRLGSSKYAVVLGAILFTFTTGEWIAMKSSNGRANCAIGFSGVLFGLTAWELVTQRAKFDWQLLLALVAMVVTPSLASRKASLRGHMLGAISGVIIGMVTNGIQKSRAQARLSSVPSKAALA